MVIPTRTIIGEFKQLMNEWSPLSRTLDSFNDRHIDRTVEQIHEINRSLHQQLWLPVGDRPRTH